MNHLEREEFMELSRAGLTKFGACIRKYEDEDGKCCAVGAFRKMKYGDAYFCCEINSRYIAGIISGFDNNNVDFAHSEDFSIGYKDGQTLRKDFFGDLT